MKMRPLHNLSLSICLLMVPLVAGADNHEPQATPITWISYVQSQTGQSQPLAQHLADNGAEIYDALRADGHILSWGVGLPINHRPGDDWNVMEWVTFRDWAAVDTFMGSFMAMQMAKSPEQLQTEQEKWYSLIVPGSHYDGIYRHVVFEVGGTEPPAYLAMDYRSPNPGKGQALVALYNEYAKPVFSKVQSDGAISSYGLAVPDVLSGGAADGFVAWYSMPNLAARDALHAAFNAAAAGWSEDVMAKVTATMDLGNAHDRIVVITHYRAGPGGDDEGDDE